MDSAFLIQSAILVSLLGTLLSGCFGLFVHSRFGRLLTYALLALANLIGCIGTIWFLSGTETRLLIVNIPVAFNLTFGLDLLSGIFYLIVTLVASLCALFAIGYLERYQSIYHLPSLAALTGIFIFGMQSVLLATNIVGFIICWEVMSVASFFLVMADREKASIKAALLYFVMTHLGAAALLAGFFLLSNGMLFADFDTLRLAAGSLPKSSIALGFLLLLFGFGSKAGLVPFHVWLPEAHPQAPSHISALMSGVMLKVALYGFLRVMGFFPILPAWFGILVLILGLASAIFGVLYATIETDIKRILAYSSIENMGLIFIMVGVGLFAMSQGQAVLGGLSLIAALFHAFLHALFKSGLFLTAGVIISETHTRRLEAMGGLARLMPQLSVLFCILMLSSIAMPPFGTFYGEWVFLQSVVATLVQVADKPLFMTVLLSALIGFVFVGGLAIFAMVKVFAISMLGKPRSSQLDHVKEPSRVLLFPIFIFALLVTGLGVFAPKLFVLFSAFDLVDGIGLSSMIQIPTAGSVTPAYLFFALIFVLLLSWIGRRLFSNSKNERLYHSWDCGQPIDASMEYTATAFSAPIRFFFRLFLHVAKSVTVTPVLATNPWIARRTMALELRLIFMEYLYLPIERGMNWAAVRVRRIQNGSIQFYLVLIFITLIATLLIAL